MPKNKKSSHTVVRERVLFLMPMISMLSNNEIFRYVSENTDWKVSERQIENYIAKAKEALKDDFEDRKKAARELSFNNYKNLYNKSFMMEDYRTCLSIQTRIDTIFGLDQIKEETKKTDTTQNLTINVNTKEVDKNIEELENL